MLENITYQLIWLGTAFRYLLFAGIVWLIFYVWKKEKWSYWKIQKKFPGWKSHKTELLYSLSTVFIFALVICAFIFYAPIRDTTRIYKNLNDMPGWYFPVSVLMLVFLHDTWFYWTHRLMHWKKIFKCAHHIHHKSHNPSPLAAFAFHASEGVIEVGVVPLAAYLFPLHGSAFGLFGLYMIIVNVIGHLGYEIFPRSFIKNKLLNWYNSSTHHNMHHHYGKGNYGLYFNLWDRWMGTNHKHYERDFLEAGRKGDIPSTNQSIPVNTKQNQKQSL